MEINSVIDKLNEAFLPKNLECDGGFCISCWKDVVREAIKMLKCIDEQGIKCETVNSCNNCEYYVKQKSRCCGRCDGVNDECVNDIICEKHNKQGCEVCYGAK